MPHATAPARPVLAGSVLFAPLAPVTDAAAFFKSPAFGELMLDVVDTLAARDPSMDFSDAAATCFVWFDRRGHEEPGFLASGRFPTPAAFRAYLRRAIWNAARAAERARRNRKEIDDPDPGAMLVSPHASAEDMASLHECLDRLPEPHRRVFDIMHDDADPPLGMTRDEWATCVLELPAPEIERLFHEACDRLLACLGFA